MHSTHLISFDQAASSKHQEVGNASDHQHDHTHHEHGDQRNHGHPDQHRHHEREQQKQDETAHPTKTLGRCAHICAHI